MRGAGGLVAAGPASISGARALSRAPSANSPGTDPPWADLPARERDFIDTGRAESRGGIPTGARSRSGGVRPFVTRTSSTELGLAPPSLIARAVRLTQPTVLEYQHEGRCTVASQQSDPLDRGGHRDIECELQAGPPECRHRGIDRAFVHQRYTNEP